LLKIARIHRTAYERYLQLSILQSEEDEIIRNYTMYTGTETTESPSPKSNSLAIIGELCDQNS
jgi:hypothetical protein